MLFSSAAFLYSFLPLTIAVYFLMPRRLKNAALLLMSLIFYAWGEPRYVVLMVLSITQGYIFARLIGKSRGTKKAKAYLIISLVLSLGMLGVFKYANFFAESFAAVFGLKIAALNIALPIGISFYTFQLISYVIDVYRADVEPQRDYVAFAAYISMFPQLIAGPIVRYSDIEAELTARAYGADKAAYGARRFILGLGKKVLIANVLAELVNAFKASGEKSTLFYWVYAAAYMLHVYFDFSGYSDMAIGLGSIFGFTFPENFNYPYIAASITEFWRRWHMSLSSWFRDYVYIPLGGSRVKRPRALLNIAIVWMLTGLWHGADWNFVMWGIMNGVIILISQELEPLYARFHKQFPSLGQRKGYQAFQIVRTFFLMGSLRMFDCYGDVPLSFSMFFSMFRDFDLRALTVNEFLDLGLNIPQYVIVFAGTVLMFAASVIGRKESVREQLSRKPYVVRYAAVAALFLAVVLFGSYGVGYDAAQFIYNQF